MGLDDCHCSSYPSGVEGLNSKRIMAVPPRFIIFFLVLVGACTPPNGDPQPIDSIRIISLAPHITELVFSAGVGDGLVGVVEYSDYPEAAKNIPRVGDAFQLDLEGIVSLQPDLVLAWSSGNPKPSLNRLEQLGVNVVAMEPNSFESIARELRLIGELTGHTQQADIAATKFLTQLDELRQQYAIANPIRVFYQISDQPIFTINGDHVISEAIRVCGGTNIFSDLDSLAPSVDLEAVLIRDPEVILFGQSFAPQARAQWQGLQDLSATQLGGLHGIQAALLSRASTRMLEGTQNMCGLLEETREVRSRLE